MSDATLRSWAALEDGRWWLHAGERRTPLEARPALLFLSADGRVAGRTEDVAAGGGATFSRVVTDGGTGPTFPRIGRPVFAPGGRTAVYGAEDGDRSFVVIGARAIETPNRSSDPVFSPDGRQVGYGARTGRELRWKTLDVP